MKQPDHKQWNYVPRDIERSEPFVLKGCKCDACEVNRKTEGTRAA